jgi:hypothetical protein
MEVSNMTARLPRCSGIAILRGLSLRLTAALTCLFAAGFCLAAPAAAQISPDGTPAKSLQQQAGPYRLQINLYADPVGVEQPLNVAVQAAPGGPPLDGATVTITGQPGLGTDATTTRAVRLNEEQGVPGSFAGEIAFSISGAWDLQVQVSGPAGDGATRVPVAVAAPRAIPVWLGWTIGLAPPVLGLIWFGWWNRGYLARLRAAEAELMQGAA